MNRRTIFGKIREMLAVLALALLAGLLLFGQAAHAQNKPAIRVKETIQVERNGDAKFQIEMKFPIGPYTNLKKNNPNTALLMRQLGLGGQGWQEIRDIQGDWHDGDSTVKIRYTAIGMVRTRKESCWEVPVSEDAALELSDMHENIAILTGALDSPMGIITSTTRLVLPENSKNIQLRKSPARVTFTMQAPTGGTKTNISFDLEAKPQMMSSLAKTHANSKFANLWVARTKIVNNGDQNIKDFKVRFRVVDFTAAWSPWHVCSLVVPTQTVTDAYFPVLDLAKVNKLNGSAHVILEAQYQYTTADGKKVEDSESEQLELLGHNTIYMSSLKGEECVGWKDQTNLGPVILASFVTHEDPIIQQVAGWISGQAGGAASSLDTKDALAYLQAINDFLVANEIKYQTPPFSVENSSAYQHVKYGRDVLRNRAGTCIDLAILWGSLCEAVGLKPVLFLIPGHCFPAVYLPNGQLVAVEATAVGRVHFKQCIDTGMKEMKQCLDGVTPHYMVNIKDLHAEGVKPLEMPTMPPETLEKWGIKKVSAARQQTQQQQPQQNNNQNGGRQIGKLTGGIWMTQLNGENGTKIVQGLAFADNGNCLWMVQAEGKEPTQKQGTFTYENDMVKMTFDGKVFSARVEWRDADHLTWIETDAQYEFARRWPQNNNSGNGGTNDTARQEQYTLAGGVWRTVLQGNNGVKIYQAFTMGTDGSFVSAFESDTGEKMELRGTYSYANGVIMLNINGGTERGTITWINANKMIYTRDGNKIEYTRSAK